jgi:hypothetical protein
MIGKICKVCGIDKSIDEFYLRKDSIDGYRNDCKECFNERAKKYKKNNPEKIKKLKHLFFERNKNDLLLKKQEYRKNNPEKYKAENKRYYEKTKIIQKVKKKKWITENREAYNQYFRTMKKNNPLYKLSCTVRGRINNILKIKSIKKKYKTFDVIGCSSEFLKGYIENQFTNGMNWENHGQFGWHIDHRIPLDSAKTEDEIYKLCHYTNLQPLWWEDNLHKSTKIV